MGSACLLGPSGGAPPVVGVAFFIGTRPAAPTCPGIATGVPTSDERSARPRRCFEAEVRCVLDVLMC
jgi:hypothetical protein